MGRTDDDSIKLQSRREAGVERLKGRAAVLRAELFEGYQRADGRPRRRARVDDRNNLRVRVAVQMGEVPALRPPAGAEDDDSRFRRRRHRCGVSEHCVGS